MILNAHFRISLLFNSELSETFRQPFERFGEYLIGDEKLDHFTEASDHIRLVPNKCSEAVQQ
jgi:hypothetical protein